MRYAIFETDSEPVLLREGEISGDDILALAVNCKATATFYIFPTFEAWQKCKRTLTYVRIIDTDLAENRIIFKGRVLIVTDNMDSSGRMWQELTCFSAAEFLEDTAHTGAITAQSLDDYMLAELTAHNNAVDLPRRLTYTVTGNARVNTDGADIIKTRYEALADILTGGKYLYKIEQSGGLINVISGYKMEWRERYANDAVYIDIAESFGTGKDTPIVLGENLKDIKIEQNSDGGIYTSVLAVGGVNSDGTRFSWTETNSALVTKYGTGRVKIVEDTSIRCTAAMYTIGFAQGAELLIVSEACRAMENAVKALASQEAAKLSEPPMKITLNAVDLARLGYADYEGFEVGNAHPVVCPPLGLYGEAMRITGIKRKLASGQIASITIERGEKTIKKSGSLSWYMAQLDEANREGVSDEVAQTEIAQTKSEEQTDGYVTKEITQEDYDNLPANSRFKTRGFCIIRNEQTGESSLMLNGTHISSGGSGGGGTIEYAAILSSEEMSEWAPQHELAPLWFRGSATVYYGQPPARFVVQGNRVLWGNTSPIENDLSSEVTFEAFDGTIKTWKVYIYSLSAVADYMRVLLGCAVYDEYGNLLESSNSATYSRVPYTAQRIKIGLVPTVSGWTLRNSKLYPTVGLTQEMFIDGARELYGTKAVGSISTPGLVPCTDAERDFGLALTTRTEPIAPT